MSQRFRIAWFSELNQDSGTEASASVSAYVTERLVPLLSREIDIELFHDKFWSSSLAPTYHFLTAARRHKENPYDLFFYQFEDRDESFFVRSHIGLKPGMVLFHALLSKSEGPEPFHYSPWESVVKKFRGESEAWPPYNSFPPQGRPFLRREGALAVLPLFSNPRNLGEFKREIKTALISAREHESPSAFYLPHPVRELPLASAAGSKALRIAFLGSPQIEDRAHKLLPALKSFSEKHPVNFTWLLSAKERPQAEELLAEFEINQAEILTGRSLQRWESLSAEVDLALHPLFSVFGDQTPYAAISLMRGLPAVVTNFASAESFPDSVVFKVFPGEHESSQYLSILEQVHSKSSKVEELRLSARAYALEIHDHSAVAEEFMTILKMKRNLFRTFDERWRIFEKQAKAQVIKQAWGVADDQIDQILKDEIYAKNFNELGWRV